MIVLCLSNDAYAAALAALDFAHTRSGALGTCDLSERFASAKAELERAYLQAIERQADTTVPALLRRQAGPIHD